jgi:predicted Zn-dependent protease
VAGIADTARNGKELSQKRLEPDDLRRLNAAREAVRRKEFSWAKFELDEMSRPAHEHPHVLEVAVTVYSGLQNHEKAVEAGGRLLESPDVGERGAVCLTLADSLHQLGRTREAYETLKRHAKGPGLEGLVHYRLAVYACLLGKSEEAKAHFARAINTPDGARLKQEARTDERLRDIWDFLCEP